MTKKLPMYRTGSQAGTDPGIVFHTKMLLTSHVQQFGDQSNSPFLSIRNLLNWQLLPDDQARVVPRTLVSKIFNVLDVLEGSGLGVPSNNVGPPPDLLAGTVQQSS